MQLDNNSLTSLPSTKFNKYQGIDIKTKISAYPADTTLALAQLSEKYKRSKRPVAVSFRALVPWLRVGERATHYLHPYPAKLLPHIAHFFLASKSFCPVSGVVLDPFAGSGTVALETCLSGRAAVYADTNPLARLITQSKVCTTANLDFGSAITSLRYRYSRSRAVHHPNVVNIAKWYAPAVIRGLVRIKAAIDQESCEMTRRLFEATFSATVRKVSNADLRLSVPVLAKEKQVPGTSEEVWECFIEQYNANVRRIRNLSDMLPKEASLTLAGPDARKLVSLSGGALSPNSIDLVITSPPYAGAQKYIRASSLSLGWLGLAEAGALKPLENVTIGREHLAKISVDAFPTTSVNDANKVIARVREKNPTRAAICATYLNEMEDVFKQIQEVLKPGGKLVLVIGNNEVCGEKFLSSNYMTTMLLALGFKVELRLVDEIKSRGLMTKRNKTASVITREWVLVFEK